LIISEQIDRAIQSTKIEEKYIEIEMQNKLLFQIMMDNENKKKKPSSY